MTQSADIYPIANLESAFYDKRSLWAVVNSFIQNKKLGFYSYQWSEEIFIPLPMLATHFDEKFAPIIADPDHLKSVRNPLILYIAAIAAWRYNLGVYKIPESICSQLMNDKNGYRISPMHIQNISEWSIYIPLHNAQLNDQTIHGVYVHKNVLEDGTPCIVMLLNTLTADNKHEFNILPYALFRTIETHNILDALIECSSAFNQESFLALFNPIFSLINLIGDTNTVIESEIFGIHKPSFKDVKESMKISDLQSPTFKLIAPSNVRNWNTGLNLAATHFKLATLHGENAVTPVAWSNGSELELIPPHL